MKELIKSKEFKITVIGGLVVLFIWATITFLYAIIKNVNYSEAFKLTWEIANTKVSLLVIVALIAILLIYLRWEIKRLKKIIAGSHFTKQEINDKLKVKLDKYQFESFEDLYDRRRLKNHPCHEIYTDYHNNLLSFKNMIYFGLLNKDYFKVDNGIAGLIAEVTEQGWIHNSDKTEIMNELTDCYTDRYDANKEELIALLNNIKTI